MTLTYETQKLKLSEYLLEKTLSRISGRDQQDIIDRLPSRSLFAGVLQAPRESDIAAAHRTDAQSPAGASLGLDFKLALKHGAMSIRLAITPSFSVYYPVFPTRDETAAANESPVANSGDNLDDDDSAKQQPPASASVVLPRKWRRNNVSMTPLTVEIGLSNLLTLQEIGRSEIDAAVAASVYRIREDRELWRHLGEPAKKERAIGNFDVLATEESYQGVLGSFASAVGLPNWTARLFIETSVDPDNEQVIRIRVYLANSTPEMSGDIDLGLIERSLFDAAVTVSFEGAVLVPFEFWLAPKDYRTNPLLEAKGINCSAVVPPDRESIRTETTPVFKQPLYRTRDDLQVSFDDLASSGTIAVLKSVAEQMDQYAQSWDDYLKSGGTVLSPEELKACQSDRSAFQEEAQRFRLGMDCLKHDQQLLAAFQFMNRVFGALAKQSGGKVKAWRLFQIGFIVSQLPCLAVREIGNAAKDEFAEALRVAFQDVAVLWFPTGGGKTEAYLGLISVALIYDRLRGKTRGVTAWMRFPLRMLSLQQMERLARVIAALNEFRDREPSLRGVGDPFSIGYFVGEANTPNAITDDEMRKFETSSSACDERRILRRCPHCSSRVEVKPIRQSWRLAHVCSNADCFSNTATSLGMYRGSVPISIVDTEIYRFLPSVLVGTVDKLAIIARARYFAHIVRGANQRCPVHGYTSYGECIERFFANCKNSGKSIEKLSPVKDPGLSLLIQDELHLLRAELGVFNGHYEGLLRYLGDQAFLRPKVLAATATIEAYDVQAFHIYLSRAQRYPQPSWSQGESFYATSTPPQTRRTYVGVLGHTRGIEEPAIRLISIYQEEIKRLMASPRDAAEIIERRDMSDDEILKLLRLYDLSLCYVNRKATGGSIVDKLSQLEDDFKKKCLLPITSQLLTGDQTIDEIGATLDRIEAEKDETGISRLSAVIATSLISHGVDLERINMMTLAGMPSHYAEYVQASSRAARSHPGIVFVCFKGRDPRESSQFEFFPAMHEHMERLIEAVAVNRFASFAPTKTVPGLLAGLLLCDTTPTLWEQRRITKPLDDLATLRIALGQRPAPKNGTESNCVVPGDLLNAIERILGVESVYPPATKAEVDNIRARVNDVFDEQIGNIGRSMERQLKAVLNPITSFRDVDEGIDFGSMDSAMYVTRLRAK